VTGRRLAVVSITVALLAPPSRPAEPDPDGRGLHWECQLLIPGGRIDALAHLGNGVIVAGSRDGRPGHVFRSSDAGVTWADLGNVVGTDPPTANVTCVASAGAGIAYLLTGDAHVWKSTDWGRSWSNLGRVSTHSRLRSFQHSYGLLVRASGTVLVSDTNPTGGHVFRSLDGGATWHDAGRVSSHALYRFEPVDDGILVNGWAGRVYKSRDDGQTWRDRGQLADSPLYATEYLGGGVALQASENGVIFRSTDDGDTWSEVARFPDAADDFVSLGDGVVLYSTYVGRKQVYLSRDNGRSWATVGRVPTGADNDALDHVISAQHEGRRFAVGGTLHGYVVRLSE
jgi:photosystem II stability/assembly factor-like uncharacterized protein